MACSGLLAVARPAAAANPYSIDGQDIGNGLCSETLVDSDLDNLVESGSAATDVGVAVSAPGTYYWIADYSGDAYNLDHQTECGDEITVIQAQDEDNVLPE